MQTSGWKLVLKTATDAANESKKCLYSLPSSEKKKPQRINLLSVNEDFKSSVTEKYAFRPSYFMTT